MEELREAGLAGVYMVLLAAARNRQHLETLHGMLKPNQRLLRRDFIILRRRWQQLWQGVRAGGDELPQSAAQFLLDGVTTATANLGRYYARRLDAGRVEVDTGSHDNLRIKESVVSGVNPPRGLAVNICGARFRMNCTFFGYQLMVEFSVPTDELTEEATYRILNLDKLMKLDRNEGRRVSWQNGHEVNFIVVFENMMDLKNHGTMQVPEGRLLQASPEFCVRLSTLLSQELRLTGEVYRLMPVREDTHWEAVRFTDRSGLTWVECYD